MSPRTAASAGPANPTRRRPRRPAGGRSPHPAVLADHRRQGPAPVRTGLAKELLSGPAFGPAPGLLKRAWALVRLPLDLIRLHGLLDMPARELSPERIRAAGSALGRLAPEAFSARFMPLLRRTSSPEFLRAAAKLAARGKAADAAECWARAVEYRDARLRAVRAFSAGSEAGAAEVSAYLDTLQASLAARGIPACDALRRLLPAATATTSSFMRFVLRMDALAGLETDTWLDGSVLSVHEAVAGYEACRDAAVSKFARTPGEGASMVRLLDKLRGRFDAMDFDAGRFERTIPEVARAASTQDEFLFWLGVLGALGKPALTMLFQAQADVLSCYRETKDDADWSGIASSLNAFASALPSIGMKAALGHLTRADLDVDDRRALVEEAVLSRHLAAAGVPPHLVDIDDPVTWKNLLEVTGGDVTRLIPSSEFRERLGSHDARSLLAKMGPKGLYSFYRGPAPPPFFRRFTEDTAGLRPGWDAPGLAFEVAYDDAEVPAGALAGWDAPRLATADGRLEGLKRLARGLERDWPAAFESIRRYFNSRKGGALGGGTGLVDALRPEDVDEAACRAVIGRLVSVPTVPAGGKAPVLLAMVELAAALRLRAALPRPGQGLEAAARYHEKLSEELRHWLVPGSKQHYAAVRDLIKARSAALSRKDGYVPVRRGTLEFHLDGRTISSLFSGVLRDDCGARMYYANQCAWPAVIQFKIMEDGLWAGGMICCVVKARMPGAESTGLLLEWVKLVRRHFLCRHGAHVLKAEFARRFVHTVRSWAGEAGFEFLAVAKQAGPSDGAHWLEFVRNALAARELPDCPPLRPAGDNGQRRYFQLSDEGLGCYNLQNETSYGELRGGGWLMELHRR